MCVKLYKSNLLLNVLGQRETPINPSPIYIQIQIVDVPTFLQHGSLSLWITELTQLINIKHICIADVRVSNRHTGCCCSAFRCFLFFLFVLTFSLSLSPLLFLALPCSGIRSLLLSPLPIAFNVTRSFVGAPMLHFFFLTIHITFTAAAVRATEWCHWTEWGARFACEMVVRGGVFQCTTTTICNMNV